MPTPSQTLSRPGGFYERPMYNRMWYDAIIDDMLAYPGTTVKDTAARLGKHPSTVGMIVNSDLFKARYEQRRAAFSLAIQERLTGKLTAVAEKGLDALLENLETKRDKVPLPLLTEITKTALDRLGYSPKAEGASVQVNVQQNAAPPTVSKEALAEARSNLRASNRQLLELDAIPEKEEPPLGEGGASSEEV